LEPLGGAQRRRPNLPHVDQLAVNQPVGAVLNDACKGTMTAQSRLLAHRGHIERSDYLQRRRSTSHKM
jgi:hypothetical protein